MKEENKYTNWKVIISGLVLMVAFIFVMAVNVTGYERINRDVGDYTILYEAVRVRVPNITRNYIYSDPVCDTRPERDNIKCDPSQVYYTETKTGTYTVKVARKRIGIFYNEQEYLNANYYNNSIYIWGYDVSNRNFIEYPKCFDYEIKRGVCKRIRG